MTTPPNYRPQLSVDTAHGGYQRVTLLSIPQLDDSKIKEIKVTRVILISIIIAVTITVFLLTGFLVSFITTIIAGVLISGLRQASKELIVEQQQKMANLQPRKILSMLVVRPDNLVSEPRETRFLETGEKVSVLEKGDTPIPDIVSVVNRDYTRYLDVILQQVDSLKQQGIKSSVVHPQACETIRELIDMAEDDITGRTSSPTSSAIADANDNLKAMTEALRDIRRLNRGNDTPPK